MTQKLETALGELRRYFEDEVPAVSAVDAVAAVLVQPPVILTQYLGTWAVERSKVDETAVSTLLQSALRKIHFQGELHLLDPEAIRNYLQRALPLVIDVCPESDR